jgi:hypothetical protein
MENSSEGMFCRPGIFQLEISRFFEVLEGFCKSSTPVSALRLIAVVSWTRIGTHIGTHIVLSHTTRTHRLHFECGNQDNVLYFSLGASALGFHCLSKCNVHQPHEL